MADRIGHAWRVLATGFCFSLFGLGGLTQRLLVFPPLNLLVRDRHRRTHLARVCIHHSFRAFAWLIVALGLMRFELRGGERLQRRGLLILANHPTLIDVVFLMACVRHADCIVKAALARNPFMSGPVRAADFVRNDGGGASLIDACAASLRAGGNLIVFPEGTRSPPTGRLPLQRGAAQIAVRTGVAVTPVRIHVTWPTLGKGQPWWRVPPRPWRMVLDVAPDIPVAPFIEAAGSEALAARRLTAHLSDHLFKEVAIEPQSIARIQPVRS